MLTLSDVFVSAMFRNITPQTQALAKQAIIVLGLYMPDVYKRQTGDWKAEKEGTKRYKQYYDSVKDRLAVRFVKVAAHTGDTYNEMAARLAKNALGIK